MTFKEYQEEARKTRQPNAGMAYFAAKLPCEAAEVAEPIVKNQFHGKPLDRKAVGKELGDLMWYMSQIADELGFTLEEIAEENIAKLRERHGEMYRPEFYRG